MLNQNRTIWPRRAKISIISMTSRWRNNNVMMTSFELTEFGSGRRILAGFISRWAIPFEWRNLRARAIEWTSDFTSLSDIIFEAADSMRLSNDPEQFIIMTHYDSYWIMLIKSNHQKVQVGLSLKIFETFEFESLWNHLKILEDFRDPSWRILKDHEDFEESC